MEAITVTSDVSTKINIINIERARDIPSGVSVQLSNLIDDNVVEQATPLSTPSSGVRNVCKQGVVLTGSTTTEIKLANGEHNFVVGNFIGTQVGGKASAITEIATESGVDTLTVETAIDTPVTGAFIYEMAAESTGLDSTLNIAYANDTASGLTDDPTSEAETIGTSQATKATVVGTVGAAGAGDVTVTVSSDLFDDEVITVAVANDDTNLIVASKFKQALLANETISTYFDVLGFEDEVILSLKSVVNGAALENTPDCISGKAFKVDQTKTMEAIPAYKSASIVSGIIGSEYMSYLKDIDEVSY